MDYSQRSQANTSTSSGFPKRTTMPNALIVNSSANGAIFYAEPGRKGCSTASRWW
jgi:hypothetical protein